MQSYPHARRSWHGPRSRSQKNASSRPPVAPKNLRRWPTACALRRQKSRRAAVPAGTLWVPSLEPKEQPATDAASAARVAKPGALDMPAILLLMGQTVPQSETGAGELEHMSMESQTIEEGGSQSLIASEELRP